MPYYICTNCQAEYYSASSTIDTSCDECDGEVKIKEEEDNE